MAIATGVWMAKTFSVLRAPRLSPSRSMIHNSSKGLPHHLSHPAKARATKVRRARDEGDDSGAALVLEDLPERPPPKVDVVVVKVFSVDAEPQRFQRGQEIVQERGLDLMLVFPRPRPSRWLFSSRPCRQIAPTHPCVSLPRAPRRSSADRMGGCRCRPSRASRLLPFSPARAPPPSRLYVIGRWRSGGAKGDSSVSVR